MHRLKLALIFLTVFIVGCGVGIYITTSETQKHVFASIPSSDLANSLTLAFSKVAERVEPSVVHITTTNTINEELIEKGTGSGFVVDKTGYILTNFHVVKDALRIRVKLYDSSELIATFIAADEETDLAVIKVTPRTKLQAITFGDSDALRVGNWVVAIGSPFGLDQTVTAGIISAKERIADKKRNLQQFLQTDAAINPGNSGGPLVNLSGELVGVNTQIATQDGAFNGIGFALPATTARNVYNQLIAKGYVSRGYIGVLLDRVSPQFAHIYQIPNQQGALIQYVNENSPAKTANLKSGDVIIEFDGHQIQDDRDLTRMVSTAEVNKYVQIKYLRDTHENTTKLYIDEKPSIETVRHIDIPELKRKDSTTLYKSAKSKLGITISTFTRLYAQQTELNTLYGDTEKGVFVTSVDPTGIAADAKIREQDIIVEINRKKIVTKEDFQEAINKLSSNDDVVFAIKRINHSDHHIENYYLSFTMQ